jgi:hypothetical protein
MQLNLTRELALLNKMKLGELKDKFAQVFGESTNSNNRTWLIRRIVWRLQANAEGGLTDRTKKRAEELADDAELRIIPPKQPDVIPIPERTITRTFKPSQDDRLPPPGTIITRIYKGEQLQVLVLVEGFEFEGKVYSSLSSLAKSITGTHTNGFLFFKLNQNGGNQ